MPIKYLEHSPVSSWYIGNVWQTSLSHPSGFIVRPWQCCHCLKYCLCPQKNPWRMRVPTPAIVKGTSFFSPSDTIPRADTKCSLFTATSPHSLQVLSSLVPSPHRLSSSIFPSWMSRQFLTGKKYQEIQSDDGTVLTQERSAQPAAQKIFRKISTNPLQALWVTLHA